MSYVVLPLSKLAYDEIAVKILLAGQSDRVRDNDHISLEDMMVCRNNRPDHQSWEENLGWHVSQADLHQKRRQIIMRVLAERGGSLPGPKLYEQDADAILKALFA